MVRIIDLVLDCDGAKTTARNHNEISVEIERVDKQEVLKHFTPEDIIEYFDIGGLLDEIGIDEVMAYFDLIEKD